MSFKNAIQTLYTIRLGMTFGAVFQNPFRHATIPKRPILCPVFP